MAEQSLKDKTAKGLCWGGLSNGLQQLLNLVFGIFLANLLTPDDYGMVGMLTIFSLIAGSIQESGFISALINKREIRHEDYNAVFWFSFFTSLCIYALLFMSAPYIANFFHQPALTALARYSFLSFVISSLGTAHTAYLYKNLMVKQKTLSSLIGLSVSGTVGIILAHNGYSYWGIATQNIVYISIVMSCYWFFSPWKPTLTFNFAPLKGMLTFSSKMLATNIFNHINNNIMSIIFGKYYSEREVGYYNQANKWNSMGYSLVSGMINGVAQPVLSKVSEEKERQLRIFRKMMRFTALISFPAMFGLSLIAPELITITITDKWAKSAEILQLLCIGGAFFPLNGLCSNLIVSKGKSNRYMWITVTLGLVQLLVAYLVHPYGIYPTLVFYTGINIAWLLVWYYFVKEEIHYRFLHLLKDIIPFFAIAMATMAITHLLTFSLANIYVVVFCKITLAPFFYITSLWLTGSQTFKECMSYFCKRDKKNKEYHARK